MQSETEYFRRVYEATYEDMLRYTVIKTRRAADIEDILQNAYSRFFSRITRRGHGDIEDPKAYLMSILQKELSGFYRFKIISLAAPYVVYILRIAAAVLKIISRNNFAA